MSEDAAWGHTEPVSQPFEIGDWSFELRGDEIANIRFDGTSLLRMIRLVARDRDWATVPSTVTEIESFGDGFDLRLSLVGFGADLVAVVKVRVRDTFMVRMHTRSASDFERNRLGLVVLHAASIAGQKLEVTHTDLTKETTAFPEQISPHQPAFDIHSLAWNCDGVDASIDFEGDVFEMEDQRNWTDASFKTYSTPLARPFPVLMRAGESVSQSLKIRAIRTAPAGVLVSAPISWVDRDRVMPTLQLGASTGSSTAVRSEHPVLIELELDKPDWRSALDRAKGVLDVRLVTDHPERVATGVAALEGREVVRAGVFSSATHVTTEPLWRALKSTMPRFALVAGTRAHFAELNRNVDELPADAPELTFSSTPQMHATERSQLVESIDIQSLTARDASRIASGRPMHIGPITLRPRFNAVATTATATIGEDAALGYGAELVPGATDPRQTSKATAAWFIASVAAFAGAGVTSLTYFEVAGPRGVQSDSGDLHPVGEAFEFLAGLEGSPLLFPSSDLPDGVHAFATLEDDGRLLAIISNLNSERRSVVIGKHAFELEPWSWVTRAVASSG